MAKTLLTPPTGSDGKRDYRYGTDGTDLTAPIILNINPDDIESGTHPKIYTVLKWRAFLRFIDSYPGFNKNDITLNSADKWATTTAQLIKDFNKDSDWAKKTEPHRGASNPFTLKDITDIQKFTKKVDPRVVVDVIPILGTQTLKMDYPSVLIKFTVDKINGKPIVPQPDQFIAVIWGNKRYVITYSNYEAAGTDVAKIVEKMELYDPTIHTRDKFYNNVNNYKEWTALEPTVIVSQSADQVNSNTTKQNINKKISSLQTEIKKAITK
jgi:hypothetical protein